MPKEVKEKNVKSPVTDIADINVTEEEPKGALYDSLTRGPGKIRKDRGAEIHEAAQVKFKRKIEDMELEIKQLNRDRRSLIDLSPDTAISLKVASDFKAEDFVMKELEIGIKIRNLDIALEIARSRYNYLFIGEV
jgi:hypothetical protein